MTTILAWVAVILLLPVHLLLWASESESQRVHRLWAAGWTQQRIANHLRISRSKVQRTLAARKPRKAA